MYNRESTKMPVRVDTDEINPNWKRHTILPGSKPTSLPDQTEPIPSYLSDSTEPDGRITVQLRYVLRSGVLEGNIYPQYVAEGSDVAKAESKLVARLFEDSERNKEKIDAILDRNSGLKYSQYSEVDQVGLSHLSKQTKELRQYFRPPQKLKI